MKINRPCPTIIFVARSELRGQELFLWDSFTFTAINIIMSQMRGKKIQRLDIPCIHTAIPHGVFNKEKYSKGQAIEFICPTRCPTIPYEIHRRSRIRDSKERLVRPLSHVVLYREWARGHRVRFDTIGGLQMINSWSSSSVLHRHSSGGQQEKVEVAIAPSCVHLQYPLYLNYNSASTAKSNMNKNVIKSGSRPRLQLFIVCKP